MLSVSADQWRAEVEGFVELADALGFVNMGT